MSKSSPDFSLEIEGVAGVCPAGERFAEAARAEGKIPVFSCEGPCIRGEIARLAANIVAHEAPYARCCHAEALFVPHSAMVRWAREAERAVVIDGCFLRCNGRALGGVLGKQKIDWFDALKIYKKYTDVFLMDDVPEEERKEVARDVANAVLAELRKKEEPKAAAS